MVAEFQQRDGTALGFQFLRKAQPAEKTDEPPIARKKGRWITAVTGALSAAAIAVGCWLPTVPTRNAATLQPEQEFSFLDMLASPEYAEFEEQYQRDYTAALLAKAEEDAAEAEELKREAVNLEEDAKALHLLAWRDNADAADLGYEQGEAIKAGVRAFVRCTEGIHGKVVEIEYPGDEYQPAIIGPVAQCISGMHGRGGTIAIAGEATVSVFDREY